MRFAPLLLLLCCAGVAQAADVKISGLPAATTLTGSEPIPTVQSLTTVATTPTQLATYTKAQLASADIRGLWSGTCDASTFLRGDGACAATLSGTVTSVALTAPAGLTVTGSPITSSGTLALTTTLNGPMRGDGSGFTTGATALGSEVSGTLPVANGGTGVATLTGLALGNGTSAFSAYAGATCTNQFLRSLAATGAGTCASVSLTADISGILPVANGGTGAGTLTGLILGNGTSAFSVAASSDVLGLWSGTCNASSYLRGDGACATTPTGTVTSVALTAPTGLTVTGSPVTGSGTLGLTTALNGPVRGNGSGLITGTTALDTEVSGTLPVANGGTGAATLTGVLKGNGTSAFTAAVASDITGLWTPTCDATTVLRGDGACAQASLTSNVSGTLPATNGGTGLATFAQGDIVYASAANTLSALAKNTNSTRYLSNQGTSNNPSWSSVNLSNGVTGDLTGTTRSGNNYTLAGSWTWNTSSAPLIVNTTGPRQEWIENDQGTDLTFWDMIVQGGIQSFRTRTDADGTGKTWLAASRTSTTAIATVDLGNTTDLPPINIKGSLVVTNAGKGLSIKEGSNAKMGTSALTAGSVVVSNTSVTATSRIFLTSQVDGGTPGFVRVSTRTAGTSFTITSSSSTDTSTIAWMLVEPSP